MHWLTCDLFNLTYLIPICLSILTCQHNLNFVQAPCLRACSQCASLAAICLRTSWTLAICQSANTTVLDSVGNTQKWKFFYAHEILILARPEGRMWSFEHALLSIRFNQASQRLPGVRNKKQLCFNSCERPKVQHAAFKTLYLNLRFGSPPQGLLLWFQKCCWKCSKIVWEANYHNNMLQAASSRGAHSGSHTLINTSSAPPGLQIKPCSVRPVTFLMCDSAAKSHR